MTDGVMASNPTRATPPLPARSAADFEMLAEAMVIMCRMGHKKMTTQQVLFFLGVAHGVSMGQSVNLASIRETYSDIGRSIEKSIAQFLAPTPRFPDALGWVTQTEDPDDRRVKYLGLSEQGLTVADALVVAIRGR
jgi:hypothetical protein